MIHKFVRWGWWYNQSTKGNGRTIFWTVPFSHFTFVPLPNKILIKKKKKKSSLCWYFDIYFWFDLVLGFGFLMEGQEERQIQNGENGGKWKWDMDFQFGFGSQRRHVDQEEGKQCDNSWTRIIESNWISN